MMHKLGLFIFYKENTWGQVDALGLGLRKMRQPTPPWCVNQPRFGHLV